MSRSVKRLLGAHMPTSKGIGNAIRAGKAIGCTAVQVFTSSPQQWKSKDVTPEMAKDVEDAKRETGIDFVVSHDSYLVNVAAQDADLREKSIAALLREMKRCGELGIPYVVSHIGSHKGAGDEQGMKLAAIATDYILENAPESVTLLIETTAGQGSSLNHRFEQIAALLAALGNHPRLAVCIDTCHLFQAGYDLRDSTSYESTMKIADSTVGLKNVHVIHANDSVKGLGMRLDRHAHIGDGQLGLECFRLMVNDPKLAHAPMLLETPDAETMHSVNLSRLYALLES